MDIVAPSHVRTSSLSSGHLEWNASSRLYFRSHRLCGSGWRDKLHNHQHEELHKDHINVDSYSTLPYTMNDVEGWAFQPLQSIFWLRTRTWHSFLSRHLTRSARVRTQDAASEWCAVGVEIVDSGINRVPAEGARSLFIVGQQTVCGSWNSFRTVLSVSRGQKLNVDVMHARMARHRPAAVAIIKWGNGKLAFESTRPDCYFLLTCHCTFVRVTNNL